MRRLSSWQRFLPVILLLAMTTFVLEARGRREVLPTHQALSSFPMQVANRQARDLPMGPDELTVLGPGEFLLRDYLSMSGEPPVNLYIAFFPSQRTGDTIHSPKNCLPGSGWAPIDSGLVSLRRADGSTISVNRYVIAKGADRDVVLYWYQAHDRVTPSEYWAKIFLVTDAIRLNRTDGSLVRVVTPIKQNESLTEAEQRAIGFSEQLLPTLEGYLPR
jgi:EpsI family protein